MLRALRTIVLPMIMIGVCACSFASGTCRPWTIGWYGQAAGQQESECMATLRGGDSSETFVIPVASSSGDDGGPLQLDCPNTDVSGPSLTECDRRQDNIHFIAEGKNADAIFDALGTMSVSVTIECNGIDFTDAGYGGSSQSCER